MGIPVSVLRGDRSCAGLVLDASLTGLLVELSEPLPFVEADVVVALVLPDAGRHDVDAEIVRRGVEEGVLAGDPQSVARGIIAVIYGLAAQASVDPQGRIPLTVEQAVEHVMKLAGARS